MICEGCQRQIEHYTCSYCFSQKETGIKDNPGSSKTFHKEVGSRKMPESTQPYETSVCGRKDAQTIAKPAMNCLEGEFILLMGSILKHGKDKYGKDNWKLPPLSEEDYSDARLRHAFKKGIDPDSGYDHLVHEAVNCMMEWWHKNNKKG